MDTKNYFHWAIARWLCKWICLQLYKTEVNLCIVSDYIILQKDTNKYLGHIRIDDKENFYIDAPNKANLKYKGCKNEFPFISDKHLAHYKLINPAYMVFKKKFGSIKYPNYLCGTEESIKIFNRLLLMSHKELIKYYKDEIK